jgi:hypothetical protein
MFTSPRAILRSCTALRQTTPETTNNVDRVAVSGSREISKTGLSVQAPSSPKIDTVAIVVHQIMTELTKAVLNENRVKVIAKLELKLMQQNGC